MLNFATCAPTCDGTFWIGRCFFRPVEKYSSVLAWKLLCPCWVTQQNYQTHPASWGKACNVQENILEMMLNEMGQIFPSDLKKNSKISVWTWGAVGGGVRKGWGGCHITGTWEVQDPDSFPKC